MKTQGYSTIMVNVTTKQRLTKAKREGESYGDTIDRLIAESKKVVLEA
jgi:predicted CopG family antitoxin